MPWTLRHATGDFDVLSAEHDILHNILQRSSSLCNLVLLNQTRTLRVNTLLWLMRCVFLLNCALGNAIEAHCDAEGHEYGTEWHEWWLWSLYRFITNDSVCRRNERWKLSNDAIAATPWHRIIMGGMVLYLALPLICDPVIGVSGHRSSWTHKRNTTSLLSIRSHFPVPEHIPNSWWHHQMETFSVLLAFCAGNSLVTGEFLAQRPVTRRFDIFFDLRLNKRLSKQSWGW